MPGMSTLEHSETDVDYPVVGNLAGIRLALAVLVGPRGKFTGATTV